jgi:hypothetical protein
MIFRAACAVGRVLHQPAGVECTDRGTCALCDFPMYVAVLRRLYLLTLTALYFTAATAASGC